MLPRRRQRNGPLVDAAAVAIAVAILAACGESSEADAPAPVEATAADPTEPMVSGGSRAQRSLVSSLVDLFRPRAVYGISIAPSPSGDVLAFDPVGIETVRFSWERDIVGAIARDEAARRGIRPFARDESHARAPPPRTLSNGDADRLRRAIREAASATESRVLELSLTRPNGAALAVVVESGDPARYLRQGVSRVLGVLYPYFSRLEGVYVAVVDLGGDTIWEYAFSRRAGRTRSVTAPLLRGCNPIPDVPAPPEVRPPCPDE